MRIAICEDNQRDREALEAILRELLEQKRISYTIQSFSHALELLDHPERGSFDVFFFDIYMQQLNGIQAAYALRRDAPTAPIVFVTSSAEFMCEGFDVGAVHYILKPASKEGVERALERCLRQIGADGRYISLICERAERKIFFREIQIVESRDKYCLFTLEKEVLQSYIRLNEVEKRLDDPRFLRCHRSYIINMDNIESALGSSFRMTNGQSVPIKRECVAATKTLFRDYRFDRVRREL